MSRIAPFWSLADLVSESANPAALQVSLEDMMSDTGRLVDDKFSQYDAKGTPFLEGDVLFGKLRPYLAKYWLADRPGTAGGDIHVYRPAPDVDPRFLRYIIGSRDFIKYAEAASKGVKMPRVEWMGIREFGVYRPDLPVQQRIADYLDREVGEIDAMIAKMDELAGRLVERRVTAVKTGALGPFSPIGGDASGVPIGAIGSVVLGKMLDVKKDRPEGATDLPYIRAANIQSNGLRLDDVKTMPFTLREADNLSLRRDDILVVEGGAVGAAVLLTEDMAGWSFQKTVNRIRPGRTVEPRWLTYVLHSYRDEGLFDLICSGTTIAHLTAEKLAALRVPLLDPDEQKRIADHLDEVTSRIDQMLAKVAELKSLLTERRAALITDVVTGRKEVA